MKIRTIDSELWLPKPIDEVFRFFSDAGNLDALTPAWLNFKIVTPMPMELKAGSLIDYKLRVRGIPISWRTEILEWDPPHRFVDHQLRGPYRQWLHTHTFEPYNGGTTIRDHVEYAVPGWFLEPIVHALFVGPDVRKIFAFRKEQIAKLLK